jgi:hypothetical protein
MHFSLMIIDEILATNEECERMMGCTGAPEPQPFACDERNGALSFHAPELLLADSLPFNRPFLYLIARVVRRAS